MSEVSGCILWADTYSVRNVHIVDFKPGESSLHSHLQLARTISLNKNISTFSVDKTLVEGTFILLDLEHNEHVYTVVNRKEGSLATFRLLGEGRPVRCPVCPELPDPDESRFCLL